MKKRAEAWFYGKVQQVFFRDFTRRFSNQQGLTGWVMNLSDGSVKAVFEGEEEDIREVIRRLKEEHPHARVDDVEITWSEFRDEFMGFDVRYR